MKLTFFIAAVLLASTAHAQQYYKADPAKLAELEAQRCAKISKEQALIQRRLTGYNQSYDVKKMQEKHKMLQADYTKYCLKSPAP